jgi:GT2 family glycosyltransferase
MNASSGLHHPTVERFVTEFAAFYLDERHHRMSLPLLARWLQAKGRPDEALPLLARYWRLGGDGTADRLLEASIRRDLAGAAAALPALRRAFAIDPTDPVVQKRCLQGLRDAGEATEADDLATKLLATAGDPDVLAMALASGRQRAVPGFGVVRGSGRTIDGWCVWRGEELCRDLMVVADGRQATFRVEARTNPAWARLGFRHAAFRFAWPAGAAIVEVRDAAGCLLRGAPLMDDAALGAGQSGPAGDPVDVTVIVPVFADAPATRECLESLAADTRSLTRARVVVVDDASPDPMIRVLLDRFAAAGRIVLLRNPHNVGFIRAVNRALRLVGMEDVVLLNADTRVPAGWLDRLRTAACEAPDIGTVTPLSNNGEVVSLPAPFRSNPMPSEERLGEIDAAASRLGGGLIDMPNGVGFCLYIRNDALRAVGPLDALRYERGYLEEVDLCLRIAAAGYRNVCATNIFVAHQGEASFGESKRALVLSNAAALVRRWPSIEAETEAYVASDPLLPVRLALAWPSLSRGLRRRLVVTGPAGLEPSILGRLSRYDSDLETAVLCAAADEPDRWLFRLPGLDLDVPPLPDMARASPADALGAAAEMIGAKDLVLAPPEGWESGLAEACFETGLPVDLLPLNARCPVPPRLMARARDILLTCPTAAAELPPGLRSTVSLPRAFEPGLADPHPGGVLGILPADATPTTYAAIKEFARAWRRRGAVHPLVVFGETFRDVGLMRTGHVFVTGPLRSEEDWREAFRLHPCAALMMTVRRPEFGHTSFEIAAQAGLPFAAYPVGGAVDLLARREDALTLDLRWDAEEVALVIESFLTLRRDRDALSRSAA